MLAISGGKGGCGKTTTTLGLAGALSGTVLAADADVDMPNLASMAGLPVESTAVGHTESDRGSGASDGAGGAGDRLRRPGAPDDTSRDGDDRPAVGRPHPADDGVRVVGPPPDSAPRRVGRWLDALPAGAVLVDCPAGAGPDAVAPMRAADGVLLVSSLCGPALRDAAKTAAMARAVGTPTVGAVLTRTGHAPDAVADLLGCPVLGSVPRTTNPLDSRSVVAEYERIAGRLDAGEIL